MLTKNILLVDDEPLFFDLLKVRTHPSYVFHYLQNSCDLFLTLEKNSIDLILMDLRLDGESGLDQVRKIRSHPTFCNIPIIMLTASTDKTSVIEGLTTGANDYITKPFDFDILIARLHAQLFRAENQSAIKLNPETFEVYFEKETVKLRRKEFLIFKTLIENPQKTFSRKDLNDLTSGEDVFVSGRSIDTFIRFLRKKLPSPNLIQTIRGKGYRINLSSPLNER